MLFKIATLLFVSLMVSSNYTCHPVSLCTPHPVLPRPVLITKKTNPLWCTRWNSWALLTGRSVFRRPLSGTTFLPIYDWVVPSCNSKLLLKLSLQFCFSELPWSHQRLFFGHRLMTSRCPFVSEKEIEGRMRGGELRVMLRIVSCVFNICSSTLHPPIPGFFLVLLV